MSRRGAGGRPAGSSGGGLGPLLLLLLGGLVVGATVLIQPKLWILAAVGVVALGIGLSSPTVPVAAMFLAMLMDQAGATGSKVADLPVTASKLAVVGTIGLWTLTSWRERLPLMRWHPVLGGLMGVVATTAISIAAAGDFQGGKFELLGLGMLTVLVGLVLASLADAPLDNLFRMLGTTFVLVLGASLAAPSTYSDTGRVTGTMGDPNEWATTVLLVTPALLGGLVSQEGLLPRVLRLGLCGLAPLAVLASESRSALLVLVLTGPAWLHLMRTQRRELLLVGGAGLLAAPVVIDFDAGMRRLEGLWNAARGGGVASDYSLAERSELLRQGIDLFKHHPFLGVGAGRFAQASGFIPIEGGMRPAHNTYLQVAAEQGVVGLFALAVLGGVVVVSLGRGWRDAPTERDRSRLLGVLVGLAATALMAATLGLMTLAMAYLVLGLGLAVHHQSRNGHVVTA
ncbi:MAG: O-antigen ligase family protein [Alphaproteobacteria bacterium]|nr:O-antigen ligase family protein [Alphaproteobacteria bacterium]